jgi:hypothetical protein
MVEEMVNDSMRIPAWWHNAIEGVGQQFDDADAFRLALIYFSIAKRFSYKFIKNERTRVRVLCKHRNNTGCAWLIHASPMRHSTTFSIKTYVSTHTCGRNSINAADARASRKWIATLYKPVLKSRPNIRPTDIKKEMQSHYGLHINYSKAWHGKERAKEDLYGSAQQSYNLLLW